MVLPEAHITEQLRVVEVIGEVGGRSLYFVVKRCLDICVALVLLALCVPLIALIALLIKLDTSGPVFFVQNRVGARRARRRDRSDWEPRSFRIYKFRSMIHNADETVHQAYIQAFIQHGTAASERSESKFKLTNDPRVTRVGRLLRKTSLDELPQLFNVIKGDMSLVGPRPVPAYEVAIYQPWHYQRLAALPGLTGLWQVKGRSRVSFDEMVQLDIEYIQHQSFWFDIKILFLTIPSILAGRGAA